MALKPIGWSLAVALVATGATGVANPGEAQTVAAQPTSTVQLSIGRGRLVTLARPMSDIFVADPAVADVQVRSPTQLYIFGKGAGETSLYATARGGAVVYSTTIRVGSNLDAVGQMLQLAMPEARITSTSLNGMVLLTGTVATPDDAAEAERLVQAFVGGATKVLSRLKSATPLQVNLQVKIAEVSRNFAKNIGVNFNNRPSATGNKPLFGFAQGKQGTFGTNSTGGTSYTFPPQSSFGSALGVAGKVFGADIIASLDLGERNGQVSTLANPNLTALSGETASFLAGGEIPIPVSQGLGAVSVEYKQYGISLAYTPTVLSDGRISLRVRPEVSELSSAGAVQINGTTIPALTTRRAETTVELGSGQSYMIAGLLQNNHNNSIDSTPGLGDVPVLGALFRSNSWQRGETELMIVVTPYLVRPVNASEIALPTDGYQAPSDWERIFLGKLGGGVSGQKGNRPTVTTDPNAAPGMNGVAMMPETPDDRDRPKQPQQTEQQAVPPRKDSGKTPAPGFSPY